MEFFASLDVLTIVAFVLLGLVVVGLLVWRFRSEDSLTATPPPPPRPDSVEQRFRETGRFSAPKFEDLVPGEYLQGSYSTQLQTDSFNLRIEAVKDRIRYIVNGVAYNTIDDIPDSNLQKVARKLYQRTFDPDTAKQREHTVIRQVQIGNQTTIESKSEEANISIHKQGRGFRYIVNGMTYYKLNDIIDPDMRRAARELIRKML